MEHAVTALADGTVSEVFVAKGELVDGGADLLVCPSELSRLCLGAPYASASATAV